MMSGVLHRHPDSPELGLESVVCELTLESAAWHLVFQLRGTLLGLLWPPARAAQREDRLWQHTCFELFVQPQASSGYREFNFSPDGRWAAYDFSAYREALPLPALSAPDIEASFSLRQARLAVRLARDALPPGPLRLGLSTVVEGGDGELAYWALAHRPGRPDFHHSDSFQLAISP